MIKKNFLFVTIISFIFVFIIYIFYNNFILNFYSCSYFKIDFNKEWKATEKGKNYLKLKNKKNGTIEIIGKVIENDELKKNIDEIYYDYEEDFRNDNKDLKLINYGETTIGKKYLKAYEYFYENNTKNTQLILIKDKNKIIQIVYSSETQFFEIDIESFNNVLNSLEV